MPRNSVVWILLLTSIIFCLAPHAVGYADYYAVIVGIADYPGAGNDLDYTDDDAIAVRDMLLTYSNWQASNITLFLDSLADKGAIQAAVSTVAAEGSHDDVFLFHFSGHGTTGIDVSPYDEVDNKDEYLCCWDGTGWGYIRDDELDTWLGQMPMEKIIILLDTCFSGGQIKGVRSINTGPAPQKGDGYTADLARIGREDVKPQDVDDITKSVVALTACDDDELSWELGNPYNHGLFTYYLLEAMDSHADTAGNGDRETSGEECYSYLNPLVVQLSDSWGLNQHPQLLDHCPGELVFLSSSSPAVFHVERELGNVFADQSFYGAAFESGAADIAEWIEVTTPVAPGDVVEFDPANAGKYRVSNNACSALVAGVISTEPGVALGDSANKEDKVLLALIGIVPVKVTNEGGPIQPGDLLVTSSTPGHAMRWDPDASSPCDFVGKALEPLQEESGIIKMLVMK